MFTVEFKINGQLVAVLSGVNQGAGGRFKSDGTPFEIANYNYEYYEMQKKIKNGKILHEPKNGLSYLVKLILEDIHK